MNQNNKIELTSFEESKLQRQQNEVGGMKVYVENLQSEGYVHYSMTVTYINPTGVDHESMKVAQYFRDMYFHNLLPNHVYENKKWIRKQKATQPYVYLFTEEHAMSSIKVSVPTSDSGIGYHHPDRLHHHAIVLVSPDHVEKFDRLIGENTLRPFSRVVMTSDIKKADSGWVDYCMKDYSRARDGLFSYGPIKLP